MYTRQEIILRSYREGKSQRCIAEELSISRKTVSKFIKDYESWKVSNINSTLSDYLSKPDSYDSSNRGKIVLTREVESSIDKLLSLNDKNRSLGLHKQLLKKVDIYNRLQSQGVSIGYTTVCNYIRGKESKRITPEAFIRQSYAPGSSCEFDWGEIKLDIGGSLQRFQLAVFTSSYSNYRYACIYNRQDTLAFMESHVSFFNYTGGVFKEMVYDNMRVAVAKFVGKYEKEPTRALLDLGCHYGFSHRFCNARRGNEKGHVERSVEYIRRKAFGFTHSFDSLEAAERHLLTIIKQINATKQQLTGKSATTLFQEEKSHLSPVSRDLNCSETVELRVDKYATVSFRTNRYSVPDHLVGDFVEIKFFSSTLEIYHKDILLGKHPRNYGKHQWVIAIEHYLYTLKRKPGALSGSLALISSGYLKQLYEAYFTQSPRDFIELLEYCKTYQVNHERLDTTVNRLLSANSTTINTERIKALLGNKTTCSSQQILEDQTTLLAKQQLTQVSSLMN
ncbi:IS21 family transposase [Aquimarina muelleri]|uniref:IS21 family transposase n=1 Tax=Aquimarina muelleri TaxID=279356 RepID=UPI003F685C6C